VFPLFHVLADAAELSGGLRAVHSSEPLRAVALAAAEPGVALRLIAANLRAAATDVRLDGLPGAQARIRRLNVESAEDATMRPEEFRASRWEPAEVLGGTLRLRLEPYEVVRVEVADR